jgi:hypothetical protein
MNGVERIAAERKRQIEEKEWDEDHDSQHTDESLALVACHYAMPECYYSEISNIWPESWDYSYDKRGKTTRIRDLEKAGALIAAEIDRLLANNRIQTDA